jgi:hypothetical protein
MDVDYTEAMPQVSSGDCVQPTFNKRNRKLEEAS